MLHEGDETNLQIWRHTQDIICTSLDNFDLVRNLDCHHLEKENRTVNLVFRLTNVGGSNTDISLEHGKYHIYK